MSFRRFSLFALLALWGLTTTARAVDKEKLRRAVSLPQLTILFGYGVNGWGEFESLGEMGPQQEKIAEMERELKGDISDVERYCRLNSLYAQANQPAKAEDAFAKAEQLLRQQLKSHPEDRASLLHLAKVLDQPETREEAESLLRRAVKEAPDDWSAWLALGRFLSNQSQRTILKGKKPLAFDPEEIARILRKTAPTKEQITSGRQLAKEADACFDRAVKLAPRAPEVYRDRGIAHYFNDNFDRGLRLYLGEKVDPRVLPLAPEARCDLRKAVALGANDYKLIGLLDLMEVLEDVYEYGLYTPSFAKAEQLKDSLSKETRQILQEHMAILTKGMEQTDRREAAEAGEVLGYLQAMILQDFPAGEKTLRRSINLDASRKAPWDMLLFAYVENKQGEKAAELSRQHLQDQDSPRNRLLLAKVYADLHQFAKAEGEVRAGLTRYPDDFLLNLALADLLLIRGGADKAEQARKIVWKLAKDDSPEATGENRWVNYRFTCGIGCGLNGQIETARQCLEEVRKREPDYPHIKKALKALDE